jgi:hypothetical protein
MLFKKKQELVEAFQWDGKTPYPFLDICNAERIATWPDNVKSRIKPLLDKLKEGECLALFRNSTGSQFNFSQLVAPGIWFVKDDPADPTGKVSAISDHVFQQQYSSCAE